MKAELVKQASEKVLDAHVLVNMISRRVRQLNGDSRMRPLIINSENLGAADIALREIIDDKMGFDMPEIVKLVRPSAQNRKRPQGWGKLPAVKGNAAT